MINKILAIIGYWLVGWTILILGRLGLIALFMSVGELASQSQFLNLAIYNAIRFDFQTLAYVAVVPSLACFLTLFICWQRKSSTAEDRLFVFFHYYFSIIYTLIAALTLFDLGFYKNFNDHLNITIFDFFNEGPLALIQAFCEEYPVTWMMLFIVAVFFIIFKLCSFRSLSSLRCSLSCVKSCLVAFLWVLSIVVMMRGSVAEFPLQVEDMYVSPSKSLNDCVPNAVYALKKAWSEKRKAFRFESEERLLRQYGFGSIDEAWIALGKDSHNLFSQQPVFDDTLAVHSQPNIVLIICESWSGYLTQLALNTKDVDMLCGMRKHLTEDLLFTNYQSVQNGTIASIENLLISTSFPRVFMSKYRYTKFPTSFATPFAESGYTTTFMSGMDEGWENVGIGLENQGFNKVFKYELCDEHPEYQFNSVGVYDHHLMNSLYEHLSRKTEMPQLYVVMTTTNHPPFVYPNDVPLPILPDSFYSNPAFANSRDIEERYLRGYQYASKSMAQFLDRFKSSSLADNTIIVITGDHNVRTALAYGNDGGLVPARWQHAVPLYIYLPKTLRGTSDGSYRCDTKKWGCHYDILPTLAPFAFAPSVKYLNIGQNLLSDSLNERNTYSYNVESTLADPCCDFDAHRRANAREVLLRLYLQEVLKVNGSKQTTSRQ